MKTITRETKITQCEIVIRLNVTEEKISETEDLAMETTQRKHAKEKLQITKIISMSCKTITGSSIYK